MAEAQRERDLLRLRPCRGDMEIREKDGGLDRLDKRIESIQSLIRELGKKRREVMSAAVKGGSMNPLSVEKRQKRKVLKGKSHLIRPDHSPPKKIPLNF